MEEGKIGVATCFCMILSNTIHKQLWYNTNSRATTELLIVIHWGVRTKTPLLQNQSHCLIKDHRSIRTIIHKKILLCDPPFPFSCFSKLSVPRQTKHFYYTLYNSIMVLTEEEISQLGWPYKRECDRLAWSPRKRWIKRFSVKLPVMLLLMMIWYIYFFVASVYNLKDYISICC